jgi:hypothetical protein
MPTFTSDQNRIVEGILAAQVNASGGTFTVAYPAGTGQTSFNAGLAPVTGYILIGENDRYAGVGLTFGASNITVTNNSTVNWLAGSKFTLNLDQVDGTEVVFVQIPFSSLVHIAANGDCVTDMRLGLDGTIEYAEFVCTQAVTTAARAATLNFEIGTTDVTGMTCALTSANLATRGVVVPFALPTGANRIRPTDTFSVEAASVTAFAEGAGYINMRVRLQPSL